MINKQLNVRISPQLFESIKEAGANQNLSPSNYAIAALSYCVENNVSFLPGGVAPANDATQIDIVGTVNEILDQFRNDLRLELDFKLAKIEARFSGDARGDVLTENEPNDVPIENTGDTGDAGDMLVNEIISDDVPTKDAGDAGSGDDIQDQQIDEDWEVIQIIRAGRELDPPKPFQQIADDLIKEKLTIPGKAGRNKPSRVNVAAIAKANKIP